jgi:hypothetical protein
VKRKKTSAKAVSKNIIPKKKGEPPTSNIQHPTSNRKLSARQEMFVREYVSGKSAAEAYTAAYGLKGHSAESAGSRLLRNVEVSELVDTLTKEARSAAVITRQQLLEFLTRGIFTPLGRVDADHELCQSAEYLTMGGVRGKLRKGKADSGNEETGPEMTTVKIKMLDKLRAAELVAKMEKWTVEQHEVKHDVGDPLLALMNRIREGGRGPDGRDGRRDLDGP